MNKLPGIRDIPTSSKSFQHSYGVLFDVLSPAVLTEDIIDNMNTGTSTDWDVLFMLSTNTYLAPLLYRRLQERKLESAVPEDFLQAIEGVYQLNVQRNKQLKAILLETIGILNRGGLTPVLLKGSHALLDLMPYSDCRMMGDIDLLLTPDTVEQARELLLAEGYYHQKEDLANPLFTDNDHIEPLFHHSGYDYVELHRRPGYASKYPDLVKYLFSSDNLITNEEAALSFQYQPYLCLFLYNQIHNYHDCLELMLTTDLRYSLEQALLLDNLAAEGLEQSFSLIGNKSPTFLHEFYLQNAFIHDFFRMPIDKRYRYIDESLRKTYQQALLLVLFDKHALLKRKIKAHLSLAAFIARKLLDVKWWSARLFNRHWYKLHLERLKEVLAGDIVIR